MSIPARVAVVGAGEVGCAWAALFAAHGAAVALVDPDPAAEARARTALAAARRIGVGGTHAAADGGDGTSMAHVTLEEAVRGAAWVQESLPERLDLKRATLGALGDLLVPDAVVASSTSTYTATELGAGLPLAGQLLVAHPLHPVYAVPVVELSGGRLTRSEVVERAAAALRAMGREPVVVRGEPPGLVANRLTAALLREAFDLVARGVVDAEALDRVVARGIALGWAAAGPLATEAIGGGAGGFPAFLDRLERPLARLWASLADWQALDPARRAALLESVRADDKAHTSGEAAWAETLARVARAAGGGAG